MWGAYMLVIEMFLSRACGDGCLATDLSVSLQMYKR